jgi:RNA-directed DNA polymerase
MDLKATIDLEDLAIVLGCSAKKLGYYLYRKPISSQYQTFAIAKRRGGFRTIRAPVTNLKIIQRNIADALEKLVVLRPCVNGFAAGRDIIRNATAHAGHSHILNIDLEDFFGSINYGRVYGLLVKKPFSLNKRVAAAIAQACTVDNLLPQGAPSSPLLSNLICARLDAELSRFASGYRCTYTRYADDMTFSTTRQTMPLAANIFQPDGATLCEIIHALRSIIEGNGFRINEEKIRLSDRKVRQEVTGLIVNKRVNVQRRFVREIRAMLHAWRKFGIDKAKADFQNLYNGGTNDFEASLRGKIGFVGQVRGRPDSVFRGLAQQFNKEAQGAPIRIALTAQEVALQAVWVFECDGDEQATAFFVAAGEIITCAHALALNPHIYHPANHTKKFKVVVKKIDQHRDLAVLTVPSELGNVLPLPIYNGAKILDGTNAILFGYPNHQLAKPVRIEEGKVIRTFPSSAVSYLETTTKIIGGNSGGPLLNKKYEVIGVAVRGLNGKVPLNQAEFLAVNGTEIGAML